MPFLNFAAMLFAATISWQKKKACSVFEDDDANSPEAVLSRGF